MFHQAANLANPWVGKFQSTIMIDGARFRVNGNDSSVFSASVVASHKDADLNGTFTATVCPAKK